MAVTIDFSRLRAQGITVNFGATTALQGVDFNVASGEIHALLGENGAGKSTLVKVLSGAVQHNEGQLLLDGTPFLPRSPLDARLAGVATIYQELSLAPHLTVAENICLGLEPKKSWFLDRLEMERRANEALAKLGHGEISINSFTGNLSLSAQQVVEIARSVAVGCKVLILDEPTSSLSRADVSTLFGLLRSLKNQGHAIIYISHFLEEVQEIADRFTVIRDGRVVTTGDAKQTSITDLVSLMIGSRVKDVYHRSKRLPGEPILRVSHLETASGIRDANFTLYKGEVLGITGLVGSGRTELLRAIFALDQVQQGEVRVAAFKGSASPAIRWRQKVGFVSENRKEEGLALSMTVADNLVLPDLSKLAVSRFLSPQSKRQAAEKWIGNLSITCRDAFVKVHTLSGGNQQKVAIARLLHSDVDVLLLDEPARGVDVKTKSRIYALVDELACQGKSILLVSSYLPELLGVCDRIAVMCKGTICNAKPATETTEEELMLEASVVN